MITMFIDDFTLRKMLKQILKERNRYQIIKEIRKTGAKIQHVQIDKFLLEKDVSLSTLKKIDKYVCRYFYETGTTPQY
jgi:fructose-1,6-bisphosphatase/sedoheptulose 1,7-bisphosphatase-like protein